MPRRVPKVGMPRENSSVPSMGSMMRRARVEGRAAAPSAAKAFSDWLALAADCAAPVPISSPRTSSGAPLAATLARAIASMAPSACVRAVPAPLRETRRAAVEHRKRVLPETALKFGVAAASPLRDFAGALSRTDRLNILAELKAASPSRGVLRDPFDPIALGRELSAAGAAALSVLTEPEFFNGSLKNLRDARGQIPLPVLRKDFIFDPWQVWESRANDADSFLLIVAALSDARLGELMALGRELKMEPLVEVHTGAELDRALTAGARILGVNNRDLKTLAVDVKTSFTL